MTRKKWILGASGFFGWFVVNGLIFQSLLNSNKGYSEGLFYASLYGGLCLFTVNIVTLIILALRPISRPVALGILAAWGVNFLICMLQGMGVAGLCGFPFFIENVTTQART
jgi:hypothetical protein